ncbi:lipid-A-disaccharide synthase [Arachidicoccus rhizosphaerae]|uniref:Lipid-A-disaccharide synthase n=2 Tax=Arachidicoccus rhizosphaerae TaxID=551991 RepID=A0A1H4BL84_9BACT|nr:lipid-A-disaccharide synthase [Arachidicoccus rhizosphaerae]
MIAGEASGDLHGSNLIRAMHSLDEALEVRCWGGDKMQAAGATLVKHYRDLAFMGFVEVVMHLRTIFKNLDDCKADILSYQPDALILIDYPGFNLRMAKWAKTQGIKVIYYISPQVWAWKESRVPAMKKSIDKMLVILPFEKPYFKNKFNWEVDYVGHPLVGAIKAFKNNPASHSLPENLESALEGKKIIAVLPGSRKQEIAKKLPIMLKMAQHFADYQFVVAQAPSLDPGYYEPFLSPYPNVMAVTGKTYALLMRAKAALVTSGTATLETALFKVPEVVCYKGSAISYQIARRLIKVKFISLVNLIMDRLIVRELIQDDLNEQNLKTALKSLLEDPAASVQLQKDYKDLEDILSAGGDASLNAARAIRQFTSHKP